MSGIDETDHRLLRAIHRRRMLNGLVLLVPTMAIWWLLYHWVERRFHVQDNVAQLGTILIVMGVVGLLSRLGLRPRRDPRETPRLSWLQNERLDRLMSRVRRVQIIGYALFLLASPVMLFDRSVSGFGWGIVVMMVISTEAFTGRLPKNMDELTLAHQATATRWAYTVTVSCCIAALLLGSHWPARLAGLVTISLLAGAVSYLLVMDTLEARAGHHDE